VLVGRAIPADTKRVQERRPSLSQGPELDRSILLHARLCTKARDLVQKRLVPRHHVLAVLLATVDGYGALAGQAAVADEPPEVVSEVLIPLLR
jgi:hypothetical protein